VTNISFGNMRRLVPMRFRVLFALFAPLPLAAAVGKWAPLPLSSFALFAAALPPITWRLGRLALFSRQAMAARYSFFDLVGIGCTLLNPVVYTLTLLSTRVQLLANLAALAVGALSWLCVLAGLLSSKHSKQRQARRLGGTAADIAADRTR